MFSTIRKAYGGGFRAGMAAPRIMGIGGKHGLKSIVAPLNPYNNVFTARWRPILALAWEAGQYDGLMKRLTTKRR